MFACEWRRGRNNALASIFLLIPWGMRLPIRGAGIYDHQRLIRRTDGSFTGRMMKRKGFTLIEILITVAILGLLTAIAIPNLLQAQVRSKVSRVKADLQSIATALGAYRADHNNFPLCSFGYQNSRARPEEQEPELLLSTLTTPVAYISAIPRDVFPCEDVRSVRFPGRRYSYRYYSRWWKTVVAGAYPLLIAGKQPTAQWALVSSGPDCTDSGGEWLMFGLDVMSRVAVEVDPSFQLATPRTSGLAGKAVAIYDPTNGSTSPGDIVRLGS